MKEQTYRALVCVTTCLRPVQVRSYLPHFARHSAEDPRFSLLVSLDGSDGETIDFCDRWAVPLIYSEEREGVGMSKNRVLERFPGFDYYFFVEDDCELVDGSVFRAHIDLHRASGFHHFSLFERGGLRGEVARGAMADHTVAHGLHGGAHFNFFTREGLMRVGGWHPRFASFRRGGHTEHSYRFWRAGLTPAPFNVVEDLSEAFIWHYPPAVSTVPEVEYGQDQLLFAERELIDAELRFVPVQTGATYHFNGIPFERVDVLASTLDHGRRYPLVGPLDRLRCRSDYHLQRRRTASSRRGRVGAVALAAVSWPANPALRHLVKTALRS